MFYFLFAPNLLSRKRCTVISVATHSAIRQKQNSCVFFGRGPERYSCAELRPQHSRSWCTLTHWFKWRWISSAVISEQRSATVVVLGSVSPIMAICNYLQPSRDLCLDPLLPLCSGGSCFGTLVWFDLICNTVRGSILSHCNLTMSRHRRRQSINVSTKRPGAAGDCC